VWFDAKGNNARGKKKTIREAETIVLFPVGSKAALGLVVASKTVDPRFDQDEAKFGILILAVTLKVLANRNSLFNEVVEVFRDVGSKSVGFENTEDFIAGDILHLGNAMRVAELDTNLRGLEALLGKLENLFADFFGSGLEPRRRSTAIRESGTRNPLSWSMHSTHGLSFAVLS